MIVLTEVVECHSSSQVTMSSFSRYMAYLVQVVILNIIHTCNHNQLTLTGRHCCLWCEIAHSDLKTPLATRNRSKERTLATIKSDHQRFIASGGNIKNAKDYNNAIGEPLLWSLVLYYTYVGMHTRLTYFPGSV